MTATYSYFTVWTTRVTNPIRIPYFHTSASIFCKKLPSSSVNLAESTYSITNPQNLYNFQKILVNKNVLYKNPYIVGVIYKMFYRLRILYTQLRRITLTTHVLPRLLAHGLAMASKWGYILFIVPLE